MLETHFNNPTYLINNFKTKIATNLKLNQHENSLKLIRWYCTGLQRQESYCYNLNKTDKMFKTAKMSLLAKIVKKRRINVENF